MRIAIRVARWIWVKIPTKTTKNPKIPTFFPKNPKVSRFPKGRLETTRQISKADPMYLQISGSNQYLQDKDLTYIF